MGTPSPWIAICLALCSVLIIPLIVLLVRLGGVLEQLKTTNGRLAALESKVDRIESNQEQQGRAIANIQGRMGVKDTNGP